MHDLLRALLVVNLTLFPYRVIREKVHVDLCHGDCGFRTHNGVSLISFGGTLTGTAYK